MMIALMAAMLGCCCYGFSITTPQSPRISSALPTASAVSSSILGDLKRIRMPGEEDSFVGSMGVPTFCAEDGDIQSLLAQDPSHIHAGGLDGVLRHKGPALYLQNVLSKEICQGVIQTCENAAFGDYQAGKNHHGALQVLVPSAIADRLGQLLSAHVDIEQVEARHFEMSGIRRKESDTRFFCSGLNRRWRVYRYAPGGDESFAPHIDAAFPPSGLSDDGSELIWDCSNNGDVVSRLTVLIYLNDDFVGGETKFYEPLSESGDGDPQVIASVKPVAGSVLMFPQAVGEEAVEYARNAWPLHEGSPVRSGLRPKYVIRSDMLFGREDTELLTEDPMFCYDHLVRGAFLPRSPVIDSKFRSHVAALYNPHMGVENAGPFLYSFLRFTKRRRVVEIGAGYTSLWILQALKDNDDELQRARELQSRGVCRLLDISWTIEEFVDDFDALPASLLCVDNCLHQKETATGASAVARALGLDTYMEFLKADAFDLDLEKDSVDVLWCDFGVGSRIKDFVVKAWPSIAPGGFLICHSTLTNLRTREWIEAARSKAGVEATGLEPDEYSEMSFLEPHKRCQNSISIFQKRKGQSGQYFSEPVYSEYA